MVEIFTLIKKTPEYYIYMIGVLAYHKELCKDLCIGESYTNM